MNTRTPVTVWPVLILIVAMGLVSSGAMAQTAPKTNEAAAGRPWTYDEAKAQLKLYPTDVCLQYIAMKLAQREGIDPVTAVMSDWQRQRQQSRERREEIDLFTIFSGSLAVQESLQLDAMRARTGDNTVHAAESILMSELKGPTVKSHPWEEMLAGRKPEMSPLMNYVPDDQYSISFRSVGTMLDLVDTGDLFASHLLSQTGQPAWKRDTEQQIKRQLAVETNPLARPFYDLVVKEIVLTGSDPFVNEGSDVTLLFRYEQELVFKTQMDAYLKTAEKSSPDVVRQQGTWEGVPYVHLTSPDRTVHVFSAYPEKGLHVRSNSLVAFQRVIDLVKGKTGEDLRSLGQSTEYAYIRTLMPYGAAEEDGLIYLSDPFIRRLVGPQVKIAELRRLKCFNHLKMIGHAATMYRTEKGVAAQTLADLEKADCLPTDFGKGTLRCSCGGTYSLSADGLHGYCSHHGHAERLIPCCEIPVSRATEAEAVAYRQFETEYSQYWRTFFDPIAIRIKSTPEKYRVETIVLPLIENSIYQGLAMAVGGKPKVQGDATTSDTILSLDFAVDKARLLQESGWQPPEPVADEEEPSSVRAAAMQASVDHLKQLALALHNYHEVNNHFPAAATVDGKGKSLLSWRVQLLPYLEQSRLFNQFKLDEPWDSPNNKPLIAQMPAIFRAQGDKTLKPGMTTYLAIVDKDSAFPPEGKTITFKNMTDGSSNTIMFIDAALENAVTWTKPDDIGLDVAVLKKSMQARFNTGGLVVFCDGAVASLVKDLPDATLRDLVTIRDGRVVGEVRDPAFVQRSSRRHDPFGLDELTGGRISEQDLYEFVAKGVGDTYSLNLCDADPMLDIQMTRMLGEMVGSSGRGGGPDPQFLMIGLAVASINSPVYVRLSLDDVEVADRFLVKLDAAMSEMVRNSVDMGFFRFEKDFYTATAKGLTAQTFVVSLGPVKWRFFFSRIGNSLCISSKLPVLEELARMEAAPKPEKPASDTTASHARITIHRDRWQKLLPTIRMGWSESARQSCLDNLGHFTMAERSLPPGADAATMNLRASEIYGVRHFCPAGGQYLLGADRQCACSIHGTAGHPTQPSSEETTGVAQKVLTSFDEARIMLTFLEDGLHAVLEIDRPVPPKTGATQK